MEHAYKFRIYPSAEQQRLIERTFGCCRYVYNHYLEQRTRAYRETGRAPTRFEQERDLTLLKRQEATLWLSEADVTALQSAIKDLDTAFQGFFRRVKNGERLGYPHFKSKRSPRQSYKSKRSGTNIKLLDGAVQLPKLGKVKCRVSKAVEGRILSATVSRNHTGKYFVSICCTDVVHQPLDKTGAAVGIAAGVDAFAVSSDAATYAYPDSLGRSYKKFARLKKSLSRKSRGSNNQRKAKAKAERMFERITNQRADMLSKLSTELLRSYDLICIESSPSGITREHSKALDADWRELRQKLRYKADWYGKRVVEVDASLLPLRELSAAQDQSSGAAATILNEGLRLLA